MIEHTIDELRDVALAADDAAGYFPALYVRVTEDIAEGIRAGRFADGQRMARLVEAFAGHYLRARRAEGPVPRCWQATWDVAADPDLVIVQHLLLGSTCPHRTAVKGRHPRAHIQALLSANSGRHFHLRQ